MCVHMRQEADHAFNPESASYRQMKFLDMRPEEAVLHKPISGRLPGPTLNVRLFSWALDILSKHTPALKPL